MTLKPRIIEPTPAPKGGIPTVNISDRAGTRIERGHLWVFSNEVSKTSDGIEPGAICRFVSSGRFVGLGYYNAHSLIAGRVMAREDGDDIAGLITHRLTRAFGQRAPLGEKDAARLVFGESDLLPGIVIDVFASAVVIQSNTAGADRLLPMFEEAVPAVFEKVFGRKLDAVIVRGDSGIRKMEGIPEFVRVVTGDEKKLRDHTFEEAGTVFSADLIGGQKTGFFLDQRDNRDHLAWRLEGAANTRVLDLFSYSGGWGLRALKAGAEHVSFVDESVDALALVEKGMRLNGLSEARARRMPRNAFDFLQNDTEKYDVVVVDPPAFAKSKKDVGQASRLSFS